MVINQKSNIRVVDCAVAPAMTPVSLCEICVAHFCPCSICRFHTAGKLLLTLILSGWKEVVSCFEASSSLA